MKPMLTLLLCILSLPVSSQEEIPSVEIAGLTVTRGMPEEAVRFELAYPYKLWCAEKSAGIDDDIEYCSIFSEEEPINVGEVTFQDGRVLTARRFLSVPEESYDAFLLLHELLADLTDGKDTCAFIRTGDSPPQFFIALPERVVGVMLHTRGNKTSIALREGLRRNPTPDLQIEDCWPRAGTDDEQG